MPLEALIPFDYAGLRLDQALARLFPDYSRARLQEWVKSGRVTVDTQLREAKSKVWGGERIALDAVSDTSQEALPQSMDLDIVYEDEALIVIEKPAGLVVHPGNGNVDGTLMNALLFHAPALATLPRAGIVHRLDKDTSGLMVIAKHERSYTNLVRQLQARTVKRIYLAITMGHTPPTGTIEATIGRHPTQRTRMAVNSRGRAAVTHFTTLAQGNRWSLVQCRLETGRTHQIRVHMAHQGFPLIGDATYGSRGRETALPPAAQGFPRQALHATRLGLAHPDDARPMEWHRPAPADFSRLLQELEQSDPAL